MASNPPSWPWPVDDPPPEHYAEVFEEEFGNPALTRTPAPEVGFVSIAAGQLLTVNDDGHVLPATSEDPSRVIGMALDRPNSEGICRITMPAGGVLEVQVAREVPHVDVTVQLVEEETMTTHKGFTNFDTRTGKQVRRFECTTGGSSKFWELEIDWTKKTYQTRWGKIGTRGQAGSVKSAKYRSEGRRRRFMADEGDKLIQSKLSKGYKEVTAPEKAEAPKKKKKKVTTLNQIKRQPLCLLD